MRFLRNAATVSIKSRQGLICNFSRDLLLDAGLAALHPRAAVAEPANRFLCYRKFGGN
jgi:hypothetical protein